MKEAHSTPRRWCQHAFRATTAHDIASSTWAAQTPLSPGAAFSCKGALRSPEPACRHCHKREVNTEEAHVIGLHRPLGATFPAPRWPVDPRADVGIAGAHPHRGCARSAAPPHCSRQAMSYTAQAAIPPHWHGLGGGQSATRSVIVPAPPKRAGRVMAILVERRATLVTHPSEHEACRDHPPRHMQAPRHVEAVRRMTAFGRATRPRTFVPPRWLKR